MCGTPLFLEATLPLAAKVQVLRGVTCHTPVQKYYYTTKSMTFPPVCCHCGSFDVEVRNGELPMCESCDADTDLEPVKSGKINKYEATKLVKEKKAQRRKAHKKAKASANDSEEEEEEEEEEEDEFELDDDEDEDKVEDEDDIGEDDSEDERNESGLGNDDQFRAVGVKRSAPESDNITGTTKPSLNDLVSSGNFEVMLKNCVGTGPSRRPCSCHDTDDFDKLKADVEDAEEEVEGAEETLSAMKQLAEPRKATKGKRKGKGKAKTGAESTTMVVEAEQELAKARALLEKAAARHQNAETRAQADTVGHNFECETCHKSNPDLFSCMGCNLVYCEGCLSSQEWSSSIPQALASMFSW